MIYVNVRYCFAILTIYCIQSITGIPSCLYPPCRYNVMRSPDDMSNIAVRDTSVHSINWSWQVRGGRWNVTYMYTYPSGWYDGRATFHNSSGIMEGQQPAMVSWGYSKNWESNAIRVHANAWNISYNGDLFGFVPTGYGRYIFRIYSKNRRHNPFGDDIQNPPGTCSLTSTDKTEMARWWTQRKAQRNCPEPTINWSWNGSRGKWKVVYKWIEDIDKTTCAVTYRNFATGEEYKVINWDLDVPKKSVSYTTNPVRIYGENSWQISLSPSENWGYTPSGNGEWTFQHFSRNLVFRPFSNFRGKINFT